jgi:hypothetical protein
MAALFFAWTAAVEKIPRATNKKTADKKRRGGEWEKEMGQKCGWAGGKVSPKAKERRRMWEIGIGRRRRRMEGWMEGRMMMMMGG